MNVLVTGGAGYLGSVLVSQLSSDETVSKIVVYDNLSKGNLGLFFGAAIPDKSKVVFVQGDILDSRKLKKNLVGIDVVYHLAAKVTTPFSDRSSHYFEQVNHWGTAELCYAIEESDVSKLIYMSSASVYGSKNEIANTQTIPAPHTFYGVSKLRGEAHVKRLEHKVATHIVRCANTYGYSPSMRLDSVINKFVFKAHNGEIININGDGNQKRAFVSISRVISLLKELLSYKEECALLNIVDYNFSILDIIESVKQQYPHLQMIFVNQHLSMRQLQLEVDRQVVQLIGEKKTTFEEDLKKLIANISIGQHR